MKGSQVFPSKNLRAEDIKGKEPIVAIDKVTTQQFDDGLKPIIHFIGAQKTLVCNRTNWNAIVDITGKSDSDEWHGLKVKLVVVKVDYQGKRVDAIRIEDPRQPSRLAARPSQRDYAEEPFTAADEDNTPDGDVGF